MTSPVAPDTTGPPSPRRVGLLGGTFDPPHVGHIVAAVWTRAAVELDEVWLLVANSPWQKAGDRVITPVEDRLAMAEAAVDGVPGLLVSDIEVRRGGDSYLVDTLEWLRSDRPGTEFSVILGTDAAAGLRTWHRWEALPGLARFVVVERPGVAAADLPTEFDFVRVAIPRLDVSSTELRARVRAGSAVDGLVAPAVSSLISGRGLYRGALV